MNDWLNTDVRRHLEALLDVTTRQHTVAAANIANVDTPGYRARELDFEAAFSDALARRQSAAHLSGERPGHLGQSGTPRSTHLHEVRDLPVRNDGNNVSIDRAMLNMAAAAGRYRAAIDLLRKEHRLVAWVISEGREG